jgi:hypothetical protein
MVMLNSAELAIQRATQNRRFDLVATIERPNGTDDGAGGLLPAAPTTFTSPCCRAPRNSAVGERVEAAKIQGQTVWEITFPALTDVRLEDRIRIEGVGYEVIANFGPKSRETARMVLCVQRSSP